MWNVKTQIRATIYEMRYLPMHYFHFKLQFGISDEGIASLFRFQDIASWISKTINTKNWKQSHLKHLCACIFLYIQNLMWKIAEEETPWMIDVFFFHDCFSSSKQPTNFWKDIWKGKEAYLFV